MFQNYKYTGRVKSNMSISIGSFQQSDWYALDNRIHLSIKQAQTFVNIERLEIFYDVGENKDTF